MGLSGEWEEVEEEGGGGVGREGGRKERSGFRVKMKEGGREGWKEGYVCEIGRWDIARTQKKKTGQKHWLQQHQQQEEENVKDNTHK